MRNYDNSTEVKNIDKNSTVRILAFFREPDGSIKTVYVSAAQLFTDTSALATKNDVNLLAQKSTVDAIESRLSTSESALVTLSETIANLPTGGGSVDDAQLQQALTEIRNSITQQGNTISSNAQLIATMNLSVGNLSASQTTLNDKIVANTASIATINSRISGFQSSIDFLSQENAAIRKILSDNNIGGPGGGTTPPATVSEDPRSLIFVTGDSIVSGTSIANFGNAGPLSINSGTASQLTSASGFLSSGLDTTQSWGASVAQMNGFDLTDGSSGLFQIEFSVDSIPSGGIPLINWGAWNRPGYQANILNTGLVESVIRFGTADGSSLGETSRQTANAVNVGGNQLNRLTVIVNRYTDKLITIFNGTPIQSANGVTMVAKNGNWSLSNNLPLIIGAWTNNGGASFVRVSAFRLAKFAPNSYPKNSVDATFAATPKAKIATFDVTTAAPSVTWTPSAATPFAKDSQWNSIPVTPVLGTTVVPDVAIDASTNYMPIITAGNFAPYIGVANASDGAKNIVINNTGPGIIDIAPNATGTISLPRWPANVTPPTGADGHVCIVDTVTNIVHSFYKCVGSDAVGFTAGGYYWARLDGSGWGDPAHFQKGERSVGVPTIGGLIRTAELSDGKTMFNHALACSMPRTTVAAYQWPATRDDRPGISYSGAMKMGSRMMLPSNFDTTGFSSIMKKIAETLRAGTGYGAFLVDIVENCPIAFYCEIGSNLTIDDTSSAADKSALRAIQAALRPMASCASYKDALGETFPVPSQKVGINLLSNRGDWLDTRNWTAVPNAFSSALQAIVIPSTYAGIALENYAIGIWLETIPQWALPTPGSTMKVSVTSTNGGTGGFKVWVNGAEGPGVQDLGNGQSGTFIWPTGSITNAVQMAKAGTGGSQITIKLECQT